MSVALMIKSITDPMDILSIPVDTEEGFYQAWNSIAEGLSLPWIQQFGIGLSITDENYTAAIKELQIFRNAIQEKHYSLTELRVSVLLERVDTLIREIETYTNTDYDLYVG